MTATIAHSTGRRLIPLLLIGSMLGTPALAQQGQGGHRRGGHRGGEHGTPVPLNETPGAPLAPLAPQVPAGVVPSTTIRTVNVEGAQRIEPDTVRSYVALRAGGAYSRELGDQALKDLYATELFANVVIVDRGEGNIVIQVRENPVVNRIVLEGNKRIKEEKIRPEIKLAPRQIFTRSKVRADVARIIELYRRQGRFAATVEPQMVLLDQNRVDIIFEITEGDKSKIRRINIIGNHKFTAARLRSEMVTKESGLTHIFSSGTSYDPDRLAYDQQKMRQFYLTQGYADFRVVSAVAELTPDKKDFIITYVVEEGERYKFGDIDLESQIRDVKAANFKYLLPMKKGDWYNAKQVEDTVDRITEVTGLLGFTPDVDPDFVRDKDTRTMSVDFKIGEAPRKFIERVDINGNTLTRDKVVRRELRLSEGDAFNSFLVKRSRDRIQSLGYFQEKFEIAQKPGSGPDRAVLEANLEEKSTGELQVSAGFSSLEKFIVDLSITQRNFMGKGQIVRASVNYSTYSKSVELGFTEPYLFDRNIAVGVDLFRRDYNSFNYVGSSRKTTYDDVTTGFQLRTGLALTEYVSLALRYGLSLDNVTLDKSTYYSVNTAGVLTCDPLIAGRYLCDAIGKRTTSSVGYSLVFNNTNNAIRPSSGETLNFSQDLAGLGGSVKYLRSRIEAAKYWGIGHGFILSLSGEAGYILPYGSKRFDSDGNQLDGVRLTDRFFLGEPQIRGFDIRGVGPRVLRRFYDVTTNDFIAGKNGKTDDALGGRAEYLAHLELQIPLGSGAKELGLRPSIFTDVGAVFGTKRPALTTLSRFQTGTDPTTGLPVYTAIPGRPVLNSKGQQQCLDASSTVSTAPTGGCAAAGLTDYLTNPIQPFQESYYGDTPKPRLSVGFGINWNSPFGPFRIDIAKALLKAKGDQPKLFTFNVGTQF